MAKILMVDDDKEFLEAGKAVLESEGHDIFLAYDVRVAEEKISSKNFDLIFLDIMMEDADDGIALAGRLKKRGVKTPIVMLSGVSKVTGYEYGKCNDVLPCTDFLEKPVSPQQLINKVNKTVKK